MGFIRMLFTLGITMIKQEFEILVVDANLNNLKLVRKLLTEKSYQVRIATSGEMALKSVQSRFPDLILLDITLPDISGFETCKQLKDDIDTENIPIIFLSELKEESDIIKGFEVGGVDFITKPFKTEILLARIQTHTQFHSLKCNFINNNQALEKNIFELKEAQTRLLESEKMVALGNMVKGVAHELNTPIGISITAISFFRAEAARLKKLFIEGKMTKKNLSDYFEETEVLGSSINISLEKAAELIKSFKLVSVEQQLGTIIKFNLRENFADIAQSFSHVFKNKNIKIKNEIPSDIMLTNFPGILYQIYTNLLNNANIHAFEDADQGIITLQAELQKNYVVLKFIDNGKGMSDQVKHQLFDEFFTTKRGKGGSGLGMNIVRTLVTEKLAGEIKVDSEVGEGTCFTLQVPNLEGKNYNNQGRSKKNSNYTESKA